MHVLLLIASIFAAMVSAVMFSAAGYALHPMKGEYSAAGIAAFIASFFLVSTLILAFVAGGM